MSVAIIIMKIIAVRTRTYILPAGGAKCAERERERERNWIGRRGELDDRAEKRWT